MTSLIVIWRCRDTWPSTTLLPTVPFRRPYVHPSFLVIWCFIARRLSQYKWSSIHLSRSGKWQVGEWVRFELEGPEREAKEGGDNDSWWFKVYLGSECMSINTPQDCEKIRMYCSTIWCFSVPPNCSRAFRQKGLLLAHFLPWPWLFSLSFFRRLSEW
jgi:hypothetical protein